MDEKIIYVLRRADSAMSKYSPLIIGWLGLIGFGLYAFGIVDAKPVILFTGMGSGMCALLAHHAIAMGWHD